MWEGRRQERTRLAWGPWEGDADTRRIWSPGLGGLLGEVGVPEPISWALCLLHLVHSRLLHQEEAPHWCTKGGFDSERE